MTEINNNSFTVGAYQFVSSSEVAAVFVYCMLHITSEWPAFTYLKRHNAGSHYLITMHLN